MHEPKSRLHKLISAQCLLFVFSARSWQVASDIIFVLMIILMAKGYTITRGKLRSMSWIKISIFFVIYALAYAALFIIESQVSMTRKYAHSQ